MYSKAQTAQLKQEFWTIFGQYIAPQLSADGLKINWVNYKTGFKHLHFRMQADQRKAVIAIEMAHPDPGIQELMMEQFRTFSKLLAASTGDAWEWELHHTDEYGKTVSLISQTLTQVSVLNKEDWPALISFFKPRIIALDEFWSSAQYSFELFRHG
ncbi:DUF4268 domain-containing protein [Pedobacter antarcticus]|uniref:DUF4268 domain-containing protein n=1 Tax=Pedobacter antarcticus TaxID=34086 RepID=UPI002930D7B0|nr:DUF4268 domain-containing protein [Pedobacter antarcticus]